MDDLTPEQRRKNMQAIKSRDTTIEIMLRKALWHRGVRYRKNELELQPGDAIYLYTDGVTEATDLNNELYGDDRLHAVLEKNKEADTKTICDVIKADVDKFVGEAPQFDDITMLALKYNGQEDAQ